MKTGRKRIAWVDIAKALGMICIVLGHTLQGTGFLRRYTYAFSVPFFFFLIGVTYRIKPAKFYYADKVRRVIVPYFCFAVISIIIFKVLGNLVDSISSSETTDILPNLWGAIYANSRTGLMKWNTPLWFLPCMLAAIAIVDVYERLFLQKKTKRVTAIRGLFAIVLTVVFLAVTEVFPKLKLPLQFETAIFMAAFMELGILFAHSNLFERLQRGVSPRTLLAVVLVCLGTGAVVSFFNGYADVRGQKLGNSLMLYICGAVLIGGGILSLSVLLSEIKSARKALAYVGQHTMGILLMHKFPILVFQTLVPISSSLLMDKSGTLPGMAWACIVTGVVIIMCLIVEKIFNPVIPWIFGNKKTGYEKSSV